MARRVFFSFHYGSDVSRANTVRNSWVTQGKEAAGFVDKADFEKLKLQGDAAVKKWIDGQLSGTSVTVVLLGADTLNRPFVQYEILQSMIKKNGIIGVCLHDIKDMVTLKTCNKAQLHTKIGNYTDGSEIYFDDIADKIYDTTSKDIYDNLGNWIETSAQKHGK